MKVVLTYFKQTGKYYSTGEYNTSLEDLSDIFNEVKSIVNRGDGPGLCKGVSQTHYVLIDVPDHKFNHPHLIIPSEIDNDEVEFQKFSDFLEDIAKKPNKFEDWELQILGGHGGYKSRVDRE